uniref:thioredoxin n=1 Tax=Agathobacter sp. TaxID=2021311 RepID=UPI004056E175
MPFQSILRHLKTKNKKGEHIMAEVILTKENFGDEVLNSDIPVLVDFWASWCGPCMMLSPVVAEIADEFAGKVKVGKVNVDEQQALAIEYKITNIPALLLFKNGKVEQTSVGFMPKQAIIKTLGL